MGSPGIHEPPPGKGASFLEIIVFRFQIVLGNVYGDGISIANMMSMDFYGFLLKAGLGSV